MRTKTIWVLLLVIGFLMPPSATVSNLHTASARQNEEKQRPEPSKSDWELLFPEGEGEGKSYVITLCQQCHTLERVAIQRNDVSGWRSVLLRMNVRGANLYDEDMAVVIKYLTEQFGPNQPPLEIPLDLNKATIEQLALFPQLTKDEATKILEARKKKAYKDIADLKQVLSDEKVARIKPFIVVH